MDGMIRHAYYSATACYLVQLHMQLQLGMQNLSKRESDLGKQTWYQVSQESRGFLTLPAWPCPSGYLTFTTVIYQPHMRQFYLYYT